MVQLWRGLQALQGSGGSLHHGSCLLQQCRVAEGRRCDWQPAGGGVGGLERVDVSTAVGALVAWGGGQAIQDGAFAVGGGQALTGQLWLSSGAAEVAQDA